MLNMLFIVRFADTPNKLDLRERLLCAHLEWLEKHQAQVLVAGSLRVEPDAPPVGACWIVEAADKAEVQSVFASDPFWTGGLRSSVEILHWSKAFPDRQTSV
jgi:uncharacterized protein YciI